MVDSRDIEVSNMDTINQIEDNTQITDLESLSPLANFDAEKISVITSTETMGGLDLGERQALVNRTLRDLIKSNDPRTPNLLTEIKTRLLSLEQMSKL